MFRLAFIAIVFCGGRVWAQAPCVSGFSILGAPEVRSSLLPHVLNGNFRDGRLVSGLHTFQGLEKYKARLMDQHGMTRAEVDQGLRVVVERSADEPAILHLDARVFRPLFPDFKDMQKTLFPRSWNIEKVVNSIRHVSQNPSETVVRKNGERILTGTFEGVKIVLRVDPENFVRAAYPELSRTK